MLLPATPGWVSLPVVVGGPRHSWLRSPGGGGVWWGCGWCVVWLVPRHSWRRFLCATPRHSWLGFAAGGGVRFPATPGWGLLAAVVRGVWCVVCGVFLPFLVILFLSLFWSFWLLSLFLLSDLGTQFLLISWISLANSVPCDTSLESSSLSTSTLASRIPPGARFFDPCAFL